MGDKVAAGNSVWRLGRLVIIAVIAVTTAVFYGDSLSATHYMPFVFGGAYAVAIVIGRPYWIRWPLVEAVLDTAFVTLVVLSTGGRSSLWIWLYLVPASGLLRTSWAGPGRLVTTILSSLVLLGSFLLAAMSTDIGYGNGPRGMIEPAAVTFDLRVEPLALGVFVMVVGAVAAAVGLVYRRREDAKEEAEEAALNESRVSELATLLLWRFSRQQDGLNEQRILDTLVRSVVKDLGYCYARAESFGEQDGADGRVQEAVRESSADVSSTREIAGKEASVPSKSQHLLIDSANNNRGRLTVSGDGEPGQERVLRVLMEQSAESLSAVRDSPGGRDPITDLPNRGSLRRTLRQNVTLDPRICVLAAEIEGLDAIEDAYGPGATDAVLVEVSKSLSRERSEVYCLHEGLYGVVPMPRPENRARTREEALLVQNSIEETIEYALLSLPASHHAASGDAEVAYACSVGFVEGVGEYSAEDLLRGIGPALEAARRDPDGIGGPGQLWRWSSIDGLLSAMANLEPRLARHLYGTADLALRIGERISYPRLGLEGLEVGALVHDVGKLTVTPRVAHGDPTELDELEHSEYRAVPKRGHTILQDRCEDDLPEEAFLAALTHRERYDGLGFPSEFAGEDIPLCGRITAVADSMDDFLRRRLEPQRGPYVIAERLCEQAKREVMTELRELLTTSRGSAFDPVVVDAALDVVDEIETKAEIIG